MSNDEQYIELHGHLKFGHELYRKHSTRETSADPGLALFSPQKEEEDIALFLSPWSVVHKLACPYPERNYHFNKVLPFLLVHSCYIFKIFDSTERN
jgi:hypothetical protein